MGWSTKVRGCIYAPVNCFIIGSIRGMYRSDGLVPVRFWGKSLPETSHDVHLYLGQWLYTCSIKSNVFTTRNEFRPKMSTILFSLERLQASQRFIREEQRVSPANVQLCSPKKCPEMVEELTCKRGAGDRATRNSSNLSYHILRLERI